MSALGGEKRVCLIVTSVDLLGLGHNGGPVPKGEAGEAFYTPTKGSDYNFDLFGEPKKGTAFHSCGECRSERVPKQCEWSVQ